MNCPIDKENVSLSLLFMLFLKSQNIYYKKYLKDTGISLQQLPILLKLLNHDYIYQKDISKDLQIDNALLTRNIRKLEDNGYIIRIEDNDNRRQNKISLTEKGLNFTKTIRDEGMERENIIINNSKHTREELITLLLDLIETSNKLSENNINEV